MEPTQEEKDEQMIRDIEQRIEEVMELLSFQKDIDKELDLKKAQNQKNKNSKELTWASSTNSKHKNIPITKHSHSNIQLIDMIKTKKKFLDNPEDLLKHLDQLTDKLLTVVERWCKPSTTKTSINRNTAKSSTK